MVLVLQLSLCALRSRANGLGIVPVESTAGLGVKQLRAILIISSNEQSDTKGSAHDGLLSIGTLTEAQGEVTDGLGGALDAEGLVVVEGVALALDAGMLDHGAGIGLEAGHGTADVAVDLDNLLDRGRLEEGGGDSLLNTEDDALRGGDTDSSGAKLDGLEGVLDLEETAFGGEGVDSPVWKMASRGQLGQLRGHGGGPGGLTVFRSCHKHLGGIVFSMLGNGTRRLLWGRAATKVLNPALGDVEREGSSRWKLGRLLKLETDVNRTRVVRQAARVRVRSKLP